ncbi:MAG: exodeoxyribonuclease V subunit gamma [Colwellia sp.]|nr:exodeoxyribonuclease V subunit gamma [Colwellia sp.]
MINLYPANKMENLLLLLNKISHVSPLGVFNQEVIVVQNAGMQHWLNLAIAKERGISMNMRYALPAQYLWQLIRTLASDDNVPEQSPYSREVLTWRIYALLATKAVVDDNDFMPATRYWRVTLASDDGYSNQENLKRYQLAGQMADLFEQYLIFRPDWLDSWQLGQGIKSLSKGNQWQAKLWQLLIQQLPYNPVELLHDAMANIAPKLAQEPSLLPKRLSFFGINSMAPMWLTFINALSEHIEIDFFHLNPCFSYWGDIISEKQAMQKLVDWSVGVEDEHLFVGNPLLANFGQQGREFLALLQDYSTVNVDLFIKASVENTNTTSNESAKSSPELILHRIQNDILTLTDAKTDAAKAPQQTSDDSILVDDSITITSCHSALREVQALHDYLLHQFNDSAINAPNNEEKLTPKDVLVMCPQIEQYAPFVNAVFTRGWQELNDEVPPLPCSIADRSAKDSDPLVGAFSELLTLPDSRFQVSQLLSFMRLPAVANKFSINEEDGRKVALWLTQATVHWGADQDHKTQLLGENANNSFTWQQGLSRLLRGFAFSDSDSIYQQQLLLAAVEGDDAILLGQLILFIEQLQSLAKQLNTPRAAIEWQRFLLEQLEQLFSTESKTDHNPQIKTQVESSLTIIEQAIAALVEYCAHAHFNEKIDLSIVVDFLDNHFSQGDASKQFMVGQVTFCSMLPMRSIPFKIIAVLGLNDGEFPRQRQPLGFDLMAQNPARLGDRSRRGDDRYLFLEALISARQALYLSYQGRSIKNNNEKQPSLVLKELMDYLTQGYGWCFSNKESDSSENQIKQLPMQPFSAANYLATKAPSLKPSFDANWLKLARNNSDTASETDLIVVDETLLIEDHAIETLALEALSADELIRFFQQPSKMFAQQALNLYLDNVTMQLDDVEPFSADHLQSYLLKQALLTVNLSCRNKPGEKNLNITKVLQAAKLCGKFPDLPTTQAQFDTWLSDTEQFSDEIISHDCDNPELIDCQISVPLALNKSCVLTAKMPVKQTKQGVQLVFYRSSSAKAKDLFSLYVHQLMVQLWQQQNLNSAAYHENLLSQVQSSCGFYFNAKAQQVEQYNVANVADAQTELSKLLNVFQQGKKQALLLNGELASLVFKQSRGKTIEMTQARFEQFWFGSSMAGKDAIKGFGEDPYIHYFWQQCPDIFKYLPQLNAVYQGLYQSVQKVAATAKKGRV